MTAPAAQPSGLRVLVTRPAGQAAEWTTALREAGVDALALPLIGIAPSPSPAAVDAAWSGLARQRLVVFVSPNAADSFMARRPAGMAWPTGVRAASLGPGTTRRLVAAGVPREAIVEPAAESAQFDSEALWARLAGSDWQDAGVLLVRGDGGRAWLADRLTAHGARVAAVAAYRRIVPVLDVGSRALLQGAIAAPGAPPVAVRQFGGDRQPAGARRRRRRRRPCDWSASLALATHPRIAERARRAGFGRVHETRPMLAAATACIQSLTV